MNTEGQQTAKMSETQIYFQLKAEIQISLKVLEQFSGKGLFDPDLNPAIYKLRGILTGMNSTENAFDL